ncbi:MAG: DNA polymerase III subunit delta [Candidatus Gracilibacteria bacterium]|nr:DNA polymerase III subunit delta [Candidatus Gracilibacteria bacterium]
MKKSNIIFFTGENQVFLQKELDRWVSVFIEKHGDFNVSKINNENISAEILETELLTMSFLGGFKLIMIEDFPSKINEKDTEKENKRNFDEIILSLLDRIPDSNFVLFIEGFPDKRKSLYKKLIDIAQVKEYKNLEGEGLRDYIRKRLINIDTDAITRLIQYKNSEINKIEAEIDKLYLFKMHDRITEDDIRKYVIPEIEISIFQLTDAIFELNPKKSIDSLNLILETNNIFQVFSTIMSNMRTFLYIIYLSKDGLSKNEIVSLLGIHPFIYDKSKNINPVKIKELFEKFVDIDKKSKSGELIQDSDNGIRLALEKSLINLKK